MRAEEELELRRRQLAAREGREGYGANVAEIKRRIAELEQQIGA